MSDNLEKQVLFHEMRISYPAITDDELEDMWARSNLNAALMCKIVDLHISCASERSQ